MSEVKDPTIKLFGKTILLVEDVSVIPTDAEVSQLNSSATTKDPIQNNQKPLGGESTGAKEEEEVELINEDPRTPNIEKETTAEGLIGPATSSGISEDPKTPTADKETSSPEAGNKEDPSDTSNPDEKTLKKPDKIVPCPRCNSMDTKFCYYNNYNVNQPRHFCKNCQRYWTAGGTMRNVPVGSGRRKNKNSPASHFRHIMVSEALQANGVHHSNSSILTLGSDSSPLCESMASALVLAEKSQNCARNGFQGNEQRILVSCGGRENGDDHSSGSSSTISIQTEKGLLNGQESVLKNIQGLPSQVPCFPVPPWSCTVPMPLPAFGPSGFPMSFYPPPPYWGCPVPNPWNMPWLSSQPSSPGRCALDPSTPNSRTLGKHARDGSRLRPSNQEKEDVREMDSERSILIPKTLRINDPNEAAKSSIWSTLGIKNENTDSISGGSLLKAFRPKGIDKNHTTDTSLVLQANPAALSRSLNFQETT